MNLKVHFLEHPIAMYCMIP